MLQSQCHGFFASFIATNWVRKSKHFAGRLFKLLLSKCLQNSKISEVEKSQSSYWGTFWKKKDFHTYNFCRLGVCTNTLECISLRILLLINNVVRLMRPLKVFSLSSSKLLKNRNSFSRFLFPVNAFSGISPIKFCPKWSSTRFASLLKSFTPI